jgi:hypothetical protein
MPAATPEILERESRDFLADTEVFLEAESGNSTSTRIVSSGHDQPELFPAAVASISSIRPGRPRLQFCLSNLVFRR